MKQYRIGDFARYLGVTPDLLKHYEDMGIIQSQRSESGYRYYPFHTTRLLIESIRLRNYGFTLREIQEILQAHSVDNARMEALLAGNMQRLEQEIQLDEALLEDYRDFQAWKQPLEKRDWDWEIRWSVPMCFLPHTDRDDFLQDPRIYEILNPLDELHPHRQIRHAGGDGRPAHLGLSGPGAGCAATRSPAQRGRDASPLAEDFLL